MSRTILCALLIAVMMFLIWPAKAYDNSPVIKPPVCACCAEEGEWYERTGKVESAQLVQLDRVRFSPTASTFTPPSAGEYEFSTSYSLTQTRQGRRWQFDLRDDKGRTGTISFMLPSTYEAFGVDLHDSPPGGLGPTLYKEWRLSGAAQLTGIIKESIRGQARFRLILQGRGNGCTEAEDFKNWTLQLSGGRVAYAFYGSLSDPE